MRDNLYAAAAKVLITPEERAPLQGYDPDKHIATPPEDIVDDLYARILMLDDGHTRSVIVSIDCCLTNEQISKVANPSGVPGGPMREFINTFPEGTSKQWAEAAGIEEDCLSVHATHTHSAPAHFPEKYTSRIKAAISQLGSELVLVRVSVGVTKCKISSNRRPTLSPNYDIPIDQTLTVAYMETVSGEPYAALVNYAAHPTLLRNPVNRVSSEFVGLAMGKLEDEVGHRFVSLFTQGFSGDVCPIFSGYGSKEDTYNHMISTSQQLYEDIKLAIAARQTIVSRPIQCGKRRVSLPTRDDFHVPELDVTISVVSLGELVLISVSGEIFNGYIEKIKPFLASRFVMFSGVANGYTGYIPTIEAFRDGLGGYEMNTTPFDEKVEAIFIQQIQALIAEVI